MTIDMARAVADAVLMEGYALYPYRASAPKNRYRWTFGALVPRAWSQAGGCEPWWLEAQLLITGDAPRITGQLRGFQIERRRTEGKDGREVAPRWDEGLLHAIAFEVPEHEASVEVTIAGGRETERVADGRIVRDRADLRLRIAMRREAIASPGFAGARSTAAGRCGATIAAERPLARIAIRVENITPWTDLEAPRDRAIAGALASTHVLLEVIGGEPLSAIDPPAWAAAVAATCTNARTYPVLIGRRAMLCAPFIMYDHPTIAPESAGDLCDATEIDELLVLRTRTLTDAEKREARATDPRAAAIIDRAEGLADDELARMHGTSRTLCGGEMIAHATTHAIGRKVRLRRSNRRTDAQDLLYEGHVATVVDVKQDVDGSTFFAVTIDDDPAAELHDWYGRYHYYRDDEVDLL